MIPKEQKYSKSAKQTAALKALIKKFKKDIENMSGDEALEYFENQYKAKVKALIQQKADPNVFYKDDNLLTLLYVQFLNSKKNIKEKKDGFRKYIDELKLDVNGHTPNGVTIAQLLAYTEYQATEPYHKMLFTVVMEHPMYDFYAIEAVDTEKLKVKEQFAAQGMISIGGRSRQKHIGKSHGLPAGFRQRLYSETRANSYLWYEIQVKQLERQAVKQYFESDVLEKIPLLSLAGLCTLKSECLKLDDTLEIPEDILALEDYFLDFPDEKLEILEAAMQKLNNIIQFYVKPNQEALAYLDDDIAFMEKAKDIVIYGHKFGLPGFINLKHNLVTAPIKLEGFNIRVTAERVSESLNEFTEQSTIKQTNEDTKEMADLLCKVYKRGADLHQNRYYLNNWNNTAKAYYDGEPIILESQWEQHSALTVLYRDKIYIANKGAGTSQPSIKAYTIGNMAALLGDMNDTQENQLEHLRQKLQEISTTVRQDRRHLGEFSGVLPGAPRFSNAAFMKDLQLTRDKVVPLKGQMVGNCSYTNTKKGVRAVIVALEDRAELETNEQASHLPENYPPNWIKSQQAVLGLNMDNVDGSAFYHEFGLYDRINGARKYLEKYRDIIEAQGIVSEMLQPIFLSFKLHNDVHSQRNLLIGEHLLDALRDFGFKDNEIIQQVENLPQNYDLWSILGNRFIEARNEEFSEQRRKSSARELGLVTTPGGESVQQKEFFAALGMDDPRLMLTDEEKEIKQRVDADIERFGPKAYALRCAFRFLANKLKNGLKKAFRIESENAPNHQQHKANRQRKPSLHQHKYSEEALEMLSSNRKIKASKKSKKKLR